MKPITFKESNIVFAKDQPEYLPLPAFKNDKGDVISLWQFNFFERIKILFTGKMWFHILTFNHPLQPQRPTLQYPFEYKKSLMQINFEKIVNRLRRLKGVKNARAQSLSSS